MKIKILSVYSIIFFLTCNIPEESKEDYLGDSNTEQNTTQDEFESLLIKSKSYLKNKDIDGDGFNDIILFNYTGGAHCCYKMKLKLSTINDTLYFPFEMDGAYEFGIVDGSQPNNFRIEDFDHDGLPEIFMKFSSYNGTNHPIDKEWSKTYGIKTNCIIFDFKDGKLIIEDYDIKCK